jgi:hypothetical protein
MSTTPLFMPQRRFYPVQRRRSWAPPPLHRRKMAATYSVPSSPQMSESSEESCTDDEACEEDYLERRVPIGNTNRPRGLGRSLSFSGAFPPSAAANMGPPPPPPVAPPPGPAAMPPIVLHPPPMPHPMIDNSLHRSNSMYSLPAMGGAADFYEQMMANTKMNANTTQPPTPNATTDVPGSTNASASGGGDHPQDQAPPQQQQPLMQISPPWLNGFVNNNNNPMFNPQQQQQQSMMQGGPPPPMMGLPPMFNNPMMAGPPPPPPLWNFINPHDIWLANQDLPLPFMNSSDPNLIAQALGGGPGGMGGSGLGNGPGNGPGNGGMGHSPRINEAQAQFQQQQQQQQQGNQIAEEELMRRSAAEEHHHHQGPSQPMMQQPMLRRGLSMMLGGLFGNSSQPKHDDFQHSSMMPPFGNFSAPIQAGGQSKKEAKLSMQYAKLGKFYCWRKMDGPPDAPFESFSIPNQKIIRRKLAKGSTTHIMLGREKKLPGDIMVDIQTLRGCFSRGKAPNGERYLEHLELREERYDGTGSNNFVFASGNSNATW